MGYEKDIFAVFAYEFEPLRFLSEAQGFTLRDAMLSHRDVAHFVRSDAMFGATRQRRASRTAGLHHARSVHHLPERANIVEKTTDRNLSFFLVRETGHVLLRQSALLVDRSKYSQYPTSQHSATKQSHRTVFLNAVCPLRVQVPYKTDKTGTLSGSRLLVRETGLEPVQCELHAPQTCASASSATLAFIG